MFENINKTGSLNCIKAKSAESLCDILRNIKVPYDLFNVYYDGESHVALILSDFRIIQKKSKKGVNNGD